MLSKVENMNPLGGDVQNTPKLGFKATMYKPLVPLRALVDGNCPIRGGSTFSRDANLKPRRSSKYSFHYCLVSYDFLSTIALDEFLQTATTMLGPTK
jgi:hypothetical protein